MRGIPLPAREPGSYWEALGAAEDSTPGAEQTLLSFAAPSSGKRRIGAVNVACVFDGRFRVTVDGVEVAAGRTGPGGPQTEFRWWPGRPLAPDAVVVVKFKAFTGTPVATAQAFANGYDAL